MKKLTFSIALVLISCFFTIPSFAAGLLDSVSSFATTALETANQIDTIGNTFEDAWDAITGDGVGPDGTFTLPAASQFNEIGNNTSARGFILNVLNFTLSFLGIIATSAIIYAGYLYVTSLGDDGKIEESKKIITYAAIGIIVILISFALVNTLITQAGIGGDDRGGASAGSSTSAAGAAGVSGAAGATGATGVNGTNGVNGTSGTNGTNGTSGTNSSSTGGTGGSGSTGGTGSTNSAVDALFSFQDGITLSGGDIQDFGDTAVISLESALAGVTIGVSIEGDSRVDLGDGLMAILNSSTPTVAHAYGTEGSYLLRSITYGSDGTQYNFQKTLVVGGTTAKFTASDTSTLIGDSILFNAASSKSSVGSISSYNWTCSGGTGCFSNISGEAISVTFSEAGTYEIELEVTNTVTSSGTASKTITILGDKPTASFVINSTQNSSKPGEYILDASESINISGENNSLTYLWNIDGTASKSTRSTLTHEFDTDGTKNISLVVTQSVSGSTLSSDSVTDSVDVEITLSVDFDITP